MIPLGDDNTCRRGKATVTWTLIAVNIAVFALYQGFGLRTDRTLALAAVPAEILSGRGLLSLVTSQFAHAGLGHLAGNMLFLAIFGDNVECRIGKARYLALYILSGLAGGLAHVYASFLSYSPEALGSPLVGASAAISGVMGAYLALFPGNRVFVLLFNFIPSTLSAWVVIGIWFLMQAVGGISGIEAGGVAYLAHLGGFAVAWLWARAYKRGETVRIARERAERLRAGSSGESGGIRWWIAD